MSVLILGRRENRIYSLELQLISRDERINTSLHIVSWKFHGIVSFSPPPPPKAMARKARFARLNLSSQFLFSRPVLLQIKEFELDRASLAKISSQISV